MDVMIDIETLSLEPNAVVCSIGACKLDLVTGTIPDMIPDLNLSQYKTFFILDPVEQQRMGRHVDAGTVMWWLQQSQEARETLYADSKKYAIVPNKEHLQALLDWIGDSPVWGNGSDFDNVVMASLFKTYGLKPWSHRQNRCYKTVKALYKDKTEKVADVGIKHHALDDAIYQAQGLIKFLHGRL